MWYLKFLFCVLIDGFDFTIGRFLWAVPLASELIGTVFAYCMFGERALWYLVEIIDISEQIDGFLPTASLIALAARNDEKREEG